MAAGAFIVETILPRSLPVIQGTILGSMEHSGIFQKLRFKGAADLQILCTASQIAKQIDAPRLRLLLQGVDLKRSLLRQPDCGADRHQRPVIPLLKEGLHPRDGIDIYPAFIFRAKPYNLLFVSEFQ